MQNARFLYLLLAVLGALIYLLISGKNSEEIDNEFFVKKMDHLVITRHGRCRMECRQITETEIREILREGEINWKKSDLEDRPCPSYVLEGYSRQEKQHIRVVVADCQTSLKLVTCIDLDKEYNCTCN